MALNIKICGIEPESIVDGRGIRYVIFTQGCPHHCPGCHNPKSHSLDGGKPMKLEVLFQEISQNPLLKGVTFSGGEPFCQPEPLAELAKMVHDIGLDVTTFTGYLYEDLLAMQKPEIQALLDQTDVLIDGPFVLAQRDLTLIFRGSSNQRMIDMNKTRKSGEIVLAE